MCKLILTLFKWRLLTLLLVKLSPIFGGIFRQQITFVRRLHVGARFEMDEVVPFVDEV